MKNCKYQNTSHHQICWVHNFYLENTRLSPNRTYQNYNRQWLSPNRTYQNYNRQWLHCQSHILLQFLRILNQEDEGLGPRRNKKHIADHHHNDGVMVEDSMEEELGVVVNNRFTSSSSSSSSSSLTNR